MRISDWSSDVCSSDLIGPAFRQPSLAGRHSRQLEDDLQLDQAPEGTRGAAWRRHVGPDQEGSAEQDARTRQAGTQPRRHPRHRSEEHTSELQSLMRISNAVFCLITKTIKRNPILWCERTEIDRDKVF